MESNECATVVASVPLVILCLGWSETQSPSVEAQTRETPTGPRLHRVHASQGGRLSDWDTEGGYIPPDNEPGLFVRGPESFVLD